MAQALSDSDEAQMRDHVHCASGMSLTCIASAYNFDSASAVLFESLHIGTSCMLPCAKL
jgi:hypothetical protein